jgi:hypothetical protein
LGKVVDNCLGCLLTLDLSWAQLRAKDLVQFLNIYRDSVKQAYMQSPLRDLNLAYNLINGKAGTSEFAQTLYEFLKDPECSNNLTHINLSGLKFSNTQLLQLCEVMSGGATAVGKNAPQKNEQEPPKSNQPFCIGLMCIHLSDVGLEFEGETAEVVDDILDMFGVGDGKDQPFLEAMAGFQRHRARHQLSTIDYVNTIEQAVSIHGLKTGKASGPFKPSE